jgi:hypothetical protein
MRFGILIFFNVEALTTSIMMNELGSFMQIPLFDLTLPLIDGYESI